MQNIALSIEQVQEISGLGRTKIYELINAGALSARKLGKRTLILKSDLEAFLSNLPSYVEKKEGAEGVRNNG